MRADVATPVVAGAGLRWAAMALAVVLALPFLGKPFHIDDTFFLRVTESIVADPVDPYGGSIDWWDRPQSLFRLDSNPPLLSYWLAPFAALSDYSERVLHAAMLPFQLLLAVAALSLARRFTVHPGWAVAFILTSVGVVVSGNVMRDVPATALGTAALAAVVAGTDADDRRWLAAGFAAAGLAVLTKYSAWLVVGLATAYPIAVRKPRHCVWAFVALVPFAAWTGHNLWVYGESHFVAQLGRGYTSPGHGWRDNLCGLPVVAGSLLFLLPALAVRSVASRDAVALTGACLAALVGVLWIHAYTGGGADAQYLSWGATGSALLYLCLLQGVREAAALARAPRDRDARDTLFLLAWLVAPLLLSVLFVPFQAVRHLLPALVPLALLGIRALSGRGGIGAPGMRTVLGVSLALQAGVALAVARADADYAEVYRDFAAGARERIAPDDGAGARIWYLGHWGWMFYARRAGFEKLHSTGPYPRPGDLLIVPAYVDKGKVLERLPQLAARMQQIDQVVYPGRLPIRTMNPAGAGFYAMFSRPRRGNPPPVPYRFTSAPPLEVFDVHRIVPVPRDRSGSGRPGS